MFLNCFALETVPLFDLGSCTDFNSMFSGCKKLSTVPPLNTGSGTDFGYMFYCNYSLKALPVFNTANGKNFGGMFSDCTQLVSVPDFDTGAGTSFTRIINNCPRIEKLPALNLSSCTSEQVLANIGWLPVSLTDFGGFIGLDQDHDCSRYPNLSHDSLLNIIRLAADVDGKTLTFTTSQLEKLNKEEIGIATGKGWMIETP